MSLLKLIIFALVFKFFCTIGVLEPKSNRNAIRQTVKIEETAMQDSVDQHKKMGASKHVPISIIIQ